MLVVGYTPSSGSATYQDVTSILITGFGRNGTANITITNGVALLQPLLMVVVDMF